MYLIKLLFGLIITKHADSVSLDKFAKVSNLSTKGRRNNYAPTFHSDDYLPISV